MKNTQTHYNNTLVTIQSDYLTKDDMMYLQKNISKEIDNIISQDSLFFKILDAEVDKKEFNKWLGRRIKVKREIVGLSLEKLSEKSGLNLNKSTMSQIESGKQNLSTYQYIKIKSVLGKDLDL